PPPPPPPDPRSDGANAARLPPRIDAPGAETRAKVAGVIKPRYPPLSRQRGEQGIVVLEVHVLTSGRAGEIRVRRDPGSRRLVAAAINAVRSARFEPAMRGGRPIESWLVVPIRFQIRDRL
ncbi:MAG: energy transducer TonB, partial [Planctomycetota bacterium]